jgi:multidrug efflux pump subunit AcrA (membrane-fusion protein)
VKKIVALSCLLLLQCSKPAPPTRYATLEADEGGAIIRKVGEGEYPPTIRFETLSERSIGDAIYVPVRVTCMKSHGVYTFDSTETTDQYTEYLNTLAQLAAARIAYERQKELFEARVVSEREYLEARLKFQEYSRIIDKIENNFRILGIPLNVIRQLGEGQILITGDVPENELHTVRKGMTIRIELHAYTGKTIEATIAGVSEQINPGTRAAKIFMRLDSKKGHYSPGMFGTGLIRRTGKQALAVPAAAVIQIGDRSFVFRQRDEATIERVAVETGNEDHGYIAIISGAKAGDKIVSRGASLLKGLSFGY